MSDQQRPPPPRVPRHPLVAVLMVICGVVLLLPGLCSLSFMAMSLFAGGMNDFFSPIIILWSICLLISVGGISMIRSASLGRRVDDDFYQDDVRDRWPPR